eukprot:m.194450 g.194450  ORF g.194450 m.194450 type:complete len:131 (-) comp10075_c1_seq2:71-463(-)
MFDVTDRESFLRVPYWINEAAKRRSGSSDPYGPPDTADMPILVVGNKTDLPRVVPRDEAEALARELHAVYVETTMTQPATAEAALETLAARIYKRALNTSGPPTPEKSKVIPLASPPPQATIQGSSGCAC